MKYYSLLIAALLLCFSTTSCEDDNSGNGSSENIDEVTLLANEFVYQIMDYYYLYNEGISKNGSPVIDYTAEKDTKEYFEKLLDKRDVFSFITDDADAFKQSQNGISTSMGWEITLMYGDEKHETVVLAVDYVYPNTPAAKAGAKRGDYIFSINGEKITPDNYTDLVNKKGKYQGSHYDSDKATAIEYELTPGVVSVSPVAESNIFTLKNGTKVGYLLYMDYYEEFNDELTSVFSKFKTEGVSRLILDLRYNPGGELTACSHLMSLIAPASVVQAEKEIIHYEFNDNLASEIGRSEDAKFKKSVLDANLDLKDVVIIQGRSTYSASEVTIIGLKPYMDVYTIGNTSGGKNTVMFTLTPDIFVNNKKENFFDKRINNWLIAPLVGVYYNSNNETFDTTDGDGMDPDYLYNEYQEAERHDLGNENEILTALALKYIANGNIPTEKSASINDFDNLVDVATYKKAKALQIPFPNKK